MHRLKNITLYKPALNVVDYFIGYRTFTEPIKFTRDSISGKLKSAYSFAITGIEIAGAMANPEASREIFQVGEIFRVLGRGFFVFINYSDRLFKKYSPIDEDYNNSEEIVTDFAETP